MLKPVFAGASQQSAQWMSDSPDFERSVVQGKMLSPLPLAIPVNEMEVATWKSKLVPQPFQDPQSYPFQPSFNHPSQLDWTLGQRAGSRIRDRPSCSLPHRPGT